MKPKRSLIGLCIALSALMLTACASSKPPAQAKPLQASLLTPCQPLPPHQGTTGADVLRTMTLWAGEFNECAERHNALVQALKD
jgi:hypothetical protein